MTTYFSTILGNWTVRGIHSP